MQPEWGLESFGRSLSIGQASNSGKITSRERHISLDGSWEDGALQSIVLAGANDQPLPDVDSTLPAKFHSTPHVQEHRTGTWLTATAHIITAVMGSGILSLSWSISTMGWIAGPAILLSFGAVTWYMSLLLADAYRHPRDTGPRNRTYPEAVRAILGGKYVYFCATVQYMKLVVIGIGYTITAAISMVAVRRASCLYSKAEEAAVAEASGGIICQVSNNPYMLIYGGFQIILSQIRNLDELWLVSTFVTLVSFAYSAIGFGLAVGKTTESDHSTGSVGGRSYAPASKAWAVMTGLGSMAFAFEFSVVLVEIQDTIKPVPSTVISGKTSETSQMKKASKSAICVTMALYTLVGCFGYSAFGDAAPINLLVVRGSSNGFVNPHWLVAVANVLVMINMLGGYQVLTQPWFAFVEKTVQAKFGSSHAIHKEFVVRYQGTEMARLTLFRLIWRTLYVCFTTLIAMLLPFFNDIVALIGAMGFWPLTVYLPIEMHIRQTDLPKGSLKWTALQVLSTICLLVSIAAGAGAIAQIVTDCQDYVPFQTKYKLN